MLYTTVRRGCDNYMDDNVLETEREGKGDGNRVNFFELFLQCFKILTADLATTLRMELFCLVKR